MNAEDTHPASDMMLADAYIGLGANLGDRMGTLQAAVDALAHHAQVVAASPVYTSAAHTLGPDEVAPDFLNAVVRVAAAHPPADLLALLHRIEAEQGRERIQQWAPRTLDLDLLVYGDLSIQREGLAVPHPRLHLRRFVLQPLSDLAPALWVSAPHCATVADLLAQCPDRHALSRYPHSLTLPDASTHPS